VQQAPQPCELVKPLHDCCGPARTNVQHLVACRRDFVIISEEPDVCSNRSITVAAPLVK